MDSACQHSKPDEYDAPFFRIYYKGVSKLKTVIKHQNDCDWNPTILPGAESLDFYIEDGGVQAQLIKLPPGAKIPRHDHPGGEAALVCEGSMEVDGQTLKAGDFLYAGSGAVHDVTTHEGVVFFLFLGSPIEWVE